MRRESKQELRFSVSTESRTGSLSPPPPPHSSHHAQCEAEEGQHVRVVDLFRTRSAFLCKRALDDSPLSLGERVLPCLRSLHLRTTPP